MVRERRCGRRHAVYLYRLVFNGEYVQQLKWGGGSILTCTWHCIDCVVATLSAGAPVRPLLGGVQQEHQARRDGGQREQEQAREAPEVQDQQVRREVSKHPEPLVR